MLIEEIYMALNYKRRKYITAGVASLLVAVTGQLLVTREGSRTLKNKISNNSKNIYTTGSSHELDNLQKVKDFNKAFVNDITLTAEQHLVFKKTLQKLLNVQKIIGYANFNLISFDEMILYARRFPQIGIFSKKELDLIDEIFFYDANNYGFYGSKVITELTSRINKKETIKISGSGHYLFQGDAVKKFNLLKKDVGSELILTSGVRSIVKQLQLFFSKLDASNGNLSLTSRSLAPPGHSYHGIGDFDVGKKGFGKFNFTEKFSDTDEYKKLIKLDYVNLRYTINNQVGVRYEPWHIKVV